MYLRGTDTCQYWLKQKWERLEAMKAERHDKAVIVIYPEATRVAVWHKTHSEVEQDRQRIRSSFAHECYKSGVHLAPTLAHGGRNCLAEQTSLKGIQSIRGD